MDKEKFIAKTFANLGTAICTVGLASYFFEHMPLFLRVGLSMSAVGMLIYSFYAYPDNNYSRNKEH